VSFPAGQNPQVHGQSQGTVQQAASNASRRTACQHAGLTQRVSKLQCLRVYLRSGMHSSPRCAFAVSAPRPAPGLAPPGSQALRPLHIDLLTRDMYIGTRPLPQPSQAWETQHAAGAVDPLPAVAAVQGRKLQHILGKDNRVRVSDSTAAPWCDWSLGDAC
jgi:hypothetical protein